MLFAGLRAILLVIGEKVSQTPLEIENLFCKKQVKVKTLRKKKKAIRKTAAAAAPTTNKIHQVVFLII